MKAVISIGSYCFAFASPADASKAVVLLSKGVAVRRELSDGREFWIPEKEGRSSIELSLVDPQKFIIPKLIPKGRRIEGYTPTLG